MFQLTQRASQNARLSEEASRATGKLALNTLNDAIEDATVPQNQTALPPMYPPSPPPGEHRLVILIGLDKPSPEVCKVMFSAMANGYPSPVILNWGYVPPQPDDGVDRSHIRRTFASVEYLDTMMKDTTHEDDRVREDDLLVMLDGLDAWWQLPPAVFIKRYHEANWQADSRLRQKWGPGRIPMKQTIVAAAQKRCAPFPKGDHGFDLHCNALPESPQRADLYGPGTDTPSPEGRVGVPDDLARKWRPTFINAGVIVGPAGDMRRYYRRVLSRIKETQAVMPRLRTDQGLHGEVWAEQEMFRTWLSKQPGRDTDGFLDLDDPLARKVLDTYEYHFGLDYFQQLSLPTFLDDHAAEFINISEQAVVAARSKELKIDPQRLLDVPEDVKTAWNPLQKVLPKEDILPWINMPLFAHFFTEAVPAIVHHNAYQDGLKKRRQLWWDRTWYFQYLRPLVYEYINRTITELPILGQVAAGEGKAVYRALPSEKVKRRPRRFDAQFATTGLPEIEFDDICREQPNTDRWFHQVFRDGKDWDF